MATAQQVRRARAPRAAADDQPRRGEWVKFWRGLLRGEKRRLSRATRFIYMELSLEARELGGDVVLSYGETDADKLHDLLGGDREEVVEAVAELTVPLDPEDPDCAPMITFSGPPERRVCTVTAWESWNRLGGDSTERVARHREKKRRSKRLGLDPGNVHVTRYTRVSLSDVTPQREREKKREKENPLSPPWGGEVPDGVQVPEEVLPPEVPDELDELLGDLEVPEEVASGVMRIVPPAAPSSVPTPVPEPTASPPPVTAAPASPRAAPPSSPDLADVVADASRWERPTLLPPVAPAARIRLPRSERRIWAPDWQAAYTRGVERARGAPWTCSWDQFQLGALERVVDARAPSPNPAVVIPWIEQQAELFARAVADDPGPLEFQPRAFESWWNRDCRPMRAPATTSALRPVRKIQEYSPPPPDYDPHDVPVPDFSDMRVRR